ncbi:MAG: hypothetical protein BRD28_01280 [Bacteroidetes bacterium QH_10_64_37]|nr:MAG: hypothetical protein BRD28_01280 [Bacteroidetes bacterium QH_10_64_37]
MPLSTTALSISEISCTNASRAPRPERLSSSLSSKLNFTTLGPGPAGPWGPCSPGGPCSPSSPGGPCSPCGPSRASQPVATSPTAVRKRRGVTK